MERSADLKPEQALLPAGTQRGLICRLTHLSNGTDIPSVRLVSAQNSVGYGYIRTPGGDVFFDASAISNLRFDQLMRDMTVEFVFDQAPYLRTSHIRVVVDGAAAV